MSAPLKIRSGYSPTLDGRGNAQVIETPTYMLWKLSVGLMDNNCYVLQCRATGETLVIDAAAEAKVLLATLDSLNLQPIAVFTTHLHRDHWGALKKVCAHFGIGNWASRGDGAAMPISPERHFEHGDTLTLGHLSLQVLGLRGHTPDGLALVLRDDHTTRIIAGDSLFPGGPGMTRSPADRSQLVNDLNERVFAEFPDHTHIHPGHGADTTLGSERPSLATWLADIS